MEEIRKVYLSPYRAGAGPRFRLTLWDTFRADGNRCVLGYRFEQLDGGGKRRTIFEGEDFRSSPMHAIDSDETVAAVLGFLTLRKGDTDADYFDRYTPEQMEFSEVHGEAVGFESKRRFDKSFRAEMKAQNH